MSAPTVKLSDARAAAIGVLLDEPASRVTAAAAQSATRAGSSSGAQGTDGTQHHARPLVHTREIGKYRLAPRYEEGELERRMAAPMVTRCGVCGDSFDGTAGTGLEWAREHRRRLHPKLVDRGQATRRKAAK